MMIKAETKHEQKRLPKGALVSRHQFCRIPEIRPSPEIPCRIGNVLFSKSPQVVAYDERRAILREHHFLVGIAKHVFSHTTVR